MFSSSLYLYLQSIHNTWIAIDNYIASTNTEEFRIKTKRTILFLLIGLDVLK